MLSTVAVSGANRSVVLSAPAVSCGSEPSSVVFSPSVVTSVGIGALRVDSNVYLMRFRTCEWIKQTPDGTPFGEQADQRERFPGSAHAGCRPSRFEDSSDSHSRSADT